MKTMMQTDFKDLGPVSRGKVRDIYFIGDYILIVTTDRISAFDVVMPNPVPSKGSILNQLSVLWFLKTRDIISNHFITADVEKYPEPCQKYAEELQGRSMLVKKATPLPVECIVRGYISGSGWKSYKNDRTVCDILLPDGLLESQELPEPIFTPSTKAEQGFHDQNISMKRAEEILGVDIAQSAKKKSLALYTRARDLAKQAGIIIADTKMEFGLLNNELILIDELLTPDSSRFWPADCYTPGGPQPSFDKQFLRDYLISIGWDQKPPAPELPGQIIAETSKKYQEALARLSPVLK
ncbi:MAG: phosphoribosylaminoimidazolesuccinocarboxamide synthase [Patescibacteria group bacterium]|jgi:phosphoribosylaminoimidazole-succinocarboxamide synthase